MLIIVSVEDYVEVCNSYFLFPEVVVLYFRLVEFLSNSFLLILCDREFFVACLLESVVFWH